MASKIEICNIALAMVNAKHIASLTENSAEAYQINVAYDPIFRALIEQHPWSFCTKIETLAQIDEDAYDFEYVYQLPADCVKPWGTIHNMDEQPDFKVRSRKFYSDESPCVLEYSYLITNTGYFHPTFVTAFAAQIAAQIAPALGAGKMQPALIQQASAALKTAKASDANTSKVRSTANRTFVNVRS